MEKRLLNYLAWAKKMSEQELTEEQRRQLLPEMLVQIQFFQHERLIHLVVTITFALLTMMSVLASLMLVQIGLFVLTVLLVILLVPYIRHYYILENGVQKLYVYYDIIGQLSHSI